MPAPALIPESTLSSPTTGRAWRSPERIAAEGMLARYAAHTGVVLHPAVVTLPSGARVLVDGATSDGGVHVEANGSSMRVIDLALATQDVFKLALVQSAHPGSRAVVLVRDDAAREALSAAIARTPPAGTVEIVVCP